MQTVAGTCKGGRRVRGVILKAKSVQVTSSGLGVATQ